MVQKARPAVKRLGRRPAFDHDTVISTAMYAFWERGFAATTLTDLEAVTGIDRSTIYNSFGGKDGLYRSAAAAYVDQAEDLLFAPLHSGRAGVADIVEFLDRLAGVLGAGDNPRGCLIVNNMATDADADATARYLHDLESGLRAALRRASTAGETEPHKNDRRRRFLASAILGVNIAHRNATDDTAAHTLISGIRAEVESWAVSEDGPLDPEPS